MYEVVHTSPQQRIRLPGLTRHTAFLYEMLYLVCRRRVGKQDEMWQVGELFSFVSRRAKSMKVN